MTPGFSLIELMIVLVIVGILSLVAYPLYSEHLFRVHRVCATAKLLDAASEMERYYLLRNPNTYKHADTAPLSFAGACCNGAYNLQVKFDSDSKYLLQAIPIGGQEKDTICGTLTLDQDGNRGASGGGARCWFGGA